MNTVREEVAKNLMFYRKRARLTQKELAELLGVRNTAVSSWESCRTEMDVDTLSSICKLLKVSATDMFGIYSGATDPLSQHERDIIDAYRAKPEMRPAVDKLLGVEEEKEETT